MEDVCSCGHVEDEHENTALGACTVGTCSCPAFEREIAPIEGQIDLDLRQGI